MAIQARVISTSPQQRTVNVQFFDSVTGAEIFRRDYPVPDAMPPTFLQDLARDEIARLTPEQTDISGLPLGAITPSAPPAPDSNAAIKAAFALQVKKVRDLLEAVRLGALPANDPSVTSAQANLATQYAANPAILLPLL